MRYPPVRVQQDGTTAVVNNCVHCSIDIDMQPWCMHDLTSHSPKSPGGEGGAVQSRLPLEWHVHANQHQHRVHRENGSMLKDCTF